MGSCFSCLSTKDKSGNKKKPQDKNATIDQLYADITNIDLGQELLNQNKIKGNQNGPFPLFPSYGNNNIWFSSA